MPSLETSLVIIKPDGVQRGLTGAILQRFEQCGLRIIGLRMIDAPKNVVEEHYAEHRDKPFFPHLVDFLCSSTVVIVAIEGAEAVANIRKMVGATEPKSALPGTIRGDYCHTTYLRANNSESQVLPNIIHASDSTESAQRELSLWFKEEDLHYINNSRCDQQFM